MGGLKAALVTCEETKVSPIMTSSVKTNQRDVRYTSETFNRWYAY